MTPVRPARPASTLGAVALLTGSLLLTACSPSASEPDDSAGSTGPKTGVSSSTYDQDYADWQRAFYGCMRAEGIDVKDPAPGELPTLDGSDPVVTAALGVCTSKAGSAPVNPDLPTTEELDEQQLTFARCMRDAGYEWADPEPVTGGNMAGAQPIDPDAYDPADLDRCATEAGFAETGSK